MRDLIITFNFVMAHKEGCLITLIVVLGYIIFMLSIDEEAPKFKSLLINILFTALSSLLAIKFGGGLLNTISIDILIITFKTMAKAKICRSNKEYSLYKDISNNTKFGGIMLVCKIIKEIIF